MIRLLLSIVISLSMISLTCQATPIVVISIKPLHSLVSAIMEGVATPTLLLASNESPHHVSLKPSQLKALSQADVILYVSRDLETGLTQALSQLSANTQVIQATHLTGITLYPTRDTEHPHSDNHDHTHGHLDPHLWLDPFNAMVILKEVTQRLVELDPEHASQYQQNAEAAIMNLYDLHLSIKKQLGSVQKTPYVTYHDAFQYFEKRYRLNFAGFMTPSPDHHLSAKRLRSIKQHLKELNIQCVFFEPSTSPALLPVLSEDLKMQSATLDPIGIDIPAGSQHYSKLIERITKEVQTCLSSKEL